MLHRKGRKSVTDYRQISNILNDFWGLYSGKKLVGIEQLYKRYGGCPFLGILMGNLNSTMRVDVSKALPEMYEVFKTYRGMILTFEDWKTIRNKFNALDEKYGKNRWCQDVMLEFALILEEDSDELSGKTKLGQPKTVGEKKAA